jgi:hypothetical protein
MALFPEDVGGATFVTRGTMLTVRVPIFNRSTDRFGQAIALQVLGISLGIKHRLYDDQVFGVWDKQFIPPVAFVGELLPGENAVGFLVDTSTYETGGQVEGERDPGIKDIYVSVSLGIPADWGPIRIEGDLVPSREYRDAFYLRP